MCARRRQFWIKQQSLILPVPASSTVLMTTAQLLSEMSLLAQGALSAADAKVVECRRHEDEAARRKLAAHRSCETLVLCQHSQEELWTAELQCNEARNVHQSARVATDAAVYMQTLVARICDHVGAGLGAADDDVMRARGDTWEGF